MSTILILGATSAVAGRIAELYGEASTAGQPHRLYLMGRRKEAVQALSEQLERQLLVLTVWILLICLRRSCAFVRLMSRWDHLIMC